MVLFNFSPADWNRYYRDLETSSLESDYFDWARSNYIGRGEDFKSSLCARINSHPEEIFFLYKDVESNMQVVHNMWRVNIKSMSVKTVGIQGWLLNGEEVQGW